MGEQHDHEHEHSDACCHDHSDEGHSHATNGKGSGGQQATEQQKTGSEGEDESDEEEDDEEDDGQADLVFPATYSFALAQLLGASSAPVSVKDIKLDGEETKLDLAMTLWKEGIVAVWPESNKKSGKNSRK